MTIARGRTDGGKHIPGRRRDPTDKVDLKVERRDLYLPPRGHFVDVDVPEMSFLAVDGHGDPNTSADYRHAVEALFAVSYAAKFLSKGELGRDYVVMPLEGVWSAQDWAAFVRRDKQAWSWVMQIRQPDWVDAEVLRRAQEQVADKQLPALPLIRRTTCTEGLSVQTLHVGSYDDEGPVLRQLHEELLPAQGRVPVGQHHEIYLSDPRRLSADRLKTVLRQPVAIGSNDNRT